MEDLVGGVFYKTNEDKIILIYGFDLENVKYITDDFKDLTINKNDIVGWEKTDLKDFPTPFEFSSLPYHFDLSYDVNTLSDLLYSIKNNNNDIIDDIDEILNSFDNESLWEGYHKEYIYEAILECLYAHDIDFHGKENCDLEKDY